MWVRDSIVVVKEFILKAETNFKIFENKGMIKKAILTNLLIINHTKEIKPF